MNILIVDDEIDTLNEICFYVKRYSNLNNEKYELFNNVVICTNPFKALEEAEKISFDIALLDIEMPGMSGLELAEKLSSTHKDVSIAFITAYNSYATEAFDVNAIDYVLKPIREERLFKALSRFVNERRRMIKESQCISQVYIQTFKKFIVKIGDNMVKWNRKKSSELLAYLIENREIPIHKEILCDLLWPDIDPKKALVSLQSTIYSIRKVFKEYKINDIDIKYSEDNYILYIDKNIVDANRFEECLGQAIEVKDKNLLENAIKIYRGEYLEQDGWLWAEVKKQKLQKIYTDAIKILNKLE